MKATRISRDEKRVLTAVIRMIEGKMEYNPLNGRYECEMGGSVVGIDTAPFQTLGRLMERMSGIL